MFETVFIRTLSSAHFSSSLFKGLYPGSTLQAVCLWALFYAYDLMISAGFMSMEELVVKLKTWISEINKMGLQVNRGRH